MGDVKGRHSATWVGCNRVVGCLDWSRQCGVVAFGAQNFVAVYDPTEGCVVGVLNGHTAQVNCLQWLDCVSESPTVHYLCSGSTDATVRVWAWLGKIGRVVAVLEFTAQAKDSQAVHYSWPAVLLIQRSRSGNAEALWICAAGNVSHPLQWDLAFRTVPPLSRCLDNRQGHTDSVLPNSVLLLALGGTDSIVRLFSSAGASDFCLVCKLCGHDDWIRGLAFCQASQSELLLASAAQDRFVRMWSIARKLAARSNPLADLSPSQSFKSAGETFNVKLEGLLTGHEDWVHSVQFNQSSVPESAYFAKRVFAPGEGKIQLLSASMDRTMIIWERDDEHRCWQQIESVGDAGSNALGYFTGVFGPRGAAILAHGFAGALHLWERDSQENRWLPVPAATGHCAEVVDICLATPKQDTSGDPFSAIISVSKDQTTRIAAKIDGRWCEIARPQVHGHDFHAVVHVPGQLPDCYLSCSEEKVVRVFTAPRSFYDYLGRNALLSEYPSLDEDKKRAYGASLKALALTNTAVYEGEEAPNTDPSRGVVESYTPGPEFAPNAQPTCVSGPPLEEHLCQNTLWPEIQKLYGHGDVVYSLAVSPCGKFLASACKAQREDVAVIFVWDTLTWTPLQQLKEHDLTVTRMQFSPSGQSLLSASRDRTFCIFEKRDEEFCLMLRKAKAHTRIIWDISWAPNEQYFATGSRDQSIKIWRFPEAPCLHHIRLEHAVTSVAFAPWKDHPNHCLLAGGMQNGAMCVWRLFASAESCRSEMLWMTDIHCMHSGAVHRVLWTMSPSKQGKYNTQWLFSCSADHSVRLFEFDKFVG